MVGAKFEIFLFASTVIRQFERLEAVPRNVAAICDERCNERTVHFEGNRSVVHSVTVNTGMKVPSSLIAQADSEDCSRVEGYQAYVQRFRCLRQVA